MVQSPARPPLKILIAVWGGPHIRRLDALGLSSFLAPGNLPAISQTHDVELVFLTCARDEALFEALPAIAEVRRYATVRYVPIDDLIAPGQYSTTLHLAFMRGIAVFGEQMTSMHFLFWNADFVLSDGALRHLGDLIRANVKVVITGTLRCVAEQTDQMLLRQRDPRTGVLAIPPRRLVELAFRYPHPHHVAKTVNQSLSWSAMPSQMLWRIDANTQIGRFFKAFMFCLKPTRVVTTINGPCDYALVPELCPGEPQHMIQDSDNAFILEVQDRDAEREFIFGGAPDEAERQTCMGEWLTAEHLDTGRRPVLFRSGPGASDRVIAEAMAGFEAYFDNFMKGVAPPNSHMGQYYWLFGVAAWNQLRETHAPGQPLPPELALPMPIEALRSPTNNRHRSSGRSKKASSTIPRDIRRRLFGEPHRPRALHPDAPSSALITASIAGLRERLQTGGRLLVVAELGNWTDLEFPDSDPNVFRLEPTPAAFWPLGADRRADAALIYVQSPQTFDVPSFLQRASGALTEHADICIIWHDPGFKGRPDWIETRLKESLSVFGLLDEVALARHQASAHDRAYASHFYNVLEASQVGWPGRCLRYARLGVAVAQRLIGKQLRGRRSGASSGRTLLAVLTGRLTPGACLAPTGTGAADEPVSMTPQRRGASGRAAQREVQVSQPTSVRPS